MSKSKNLLLIVVLFVFIQCDVNTGKVNYFNDNVDTISVNKKFSNINNELYNPKEISTLSKEKILVSDQAGDGLYKIDLDSDSIIDRSGKGNGPGEVGARGQIHLEILNDTLIWIHARNYRRSKIMTTGFKEKRRVTRGKSMYAAMLNDTILVQIPWNRRSFANLYNLKNGNTINQLDIKNKAFERVYENWILREGEIMSCKNGVLFGFKYSSYLVNIQSDSIDVIDNDINKIDFPEETKKESKNYFVRPSTRNPIGTLSISCEGNDVYVLFSGKYIPQSESIKAGFKGFSELAAKLEWANTIMVYDMKEDKVTRRIMLPLETRDIAVNGNVLYAISKLDKGPGLGKFELR